MMLSEPVILKSSSMILNLNPQIRIFCAFLFSICVSLSRDFVFLSAYAGLVLMLVALAKVNLRQVLKRIQPVLLFLLMIWIILPLTYHQKPYHHIGIFKVSETGLLLCGLISIKSILILAVFTVLVASMPAAAIGRGLHMLHVPDKLVFLFLMAYRYIHVIQEEYQRLMRAAKFRGFVPRTNLHTYKTYAYLAGMLFVRASFRANRVYRAMLCRGFCGKFHTLDIYPSHFSNKIFVAVTLAAGPCLSGLEFFWK